MIAVIGVAGSGVERLMETAAAAGLAEGFRFHVDAGMTALTGSGGAVGHIVANYAGVSSAVHGAGTAGTWPEVKFGGMMPESWYAGFAGRIVRLAPVSVTRLPASQIEALVVMTAPVGALVARRLNMARGLRRAVQGMAGAGPDAAHDAARLLQLDLAALSAIPARTAEELRRFDAACAYAEDLFPDKITRLDYSAGSAVLELPGVRLDVAEPPEPVRVFGDPASSFPASILERAAREVAAALDQLPAFVHKMWYCSRLNSRVTEQVCRDCVKNPAPFIDDAAGGWELMPCAYEMRHGPEPHISAEESVDNHSWVKAQFA